MKLFYVTAFLIIHFPILTVAQSEIDELSLKYTKSSLGLFKEFLSIPNDAHYSEYINKNIEWVEAEFQKRGFETRHLKTAGHPLVLAEQTFKKAKSTLLIYLQVDGQPVDSSFWHQPSPYLPVVKKYNGGNWEIIPWKNLQEQYDPENRIFARSTSDAKGPVVMFLAAFDALKELKRSPNYNIKIIFDFEEEMGSPNLPDAVLQNKDLLKADGLIIFDGPRHISNKPTLTFGARGIATVTLKVFGPNNPQHSGHYGNYAPNPALKLSKLLASMKDENHVVSIPGWYEGVKLTEDDKKILKQVPDNEDEIRANIGISAIDGVAETYQEAIQYPSLNIRGLNAGWVGNEVRTIIPAYAIAEIDIRLVKESQPENLIQLLKKHINEQGYHFVEGNPSQEERAQYPHLISFDYSVSYEAFRTNFNTDLGKFLRRSMTNAFGNDLIQIRTSGGSIPISPFVNTLNIPAITVPTVNRDNNQHSPNENIRLGNYQEGIKTMIYILKEKY